MCNKKVSIIIIFSLLSISLFGCNIKNPLNNILQNKETNIQNNKVNNTNTLDDDSYYSIIQGNVKVESNDYLDSYVRYPKIVRSTGIEDNLVDIINDEITKEIDGIILDMKNTAESTYKTYLQSSVENIKNDKIKKINDLKNKYKNIMGPDEVKSLNFALEQISNIKIKEKKHEKKNGRKASDSILNAFNNAEEMVNQGPHNKNIIIVETTDNSDEIKQTTTVIEGGPSKIVPEYNAGNDKQRFIKFQKSSSSNIDDKQNFDKPIYEKPTETTVYEKKSETKNVTVENNNIVNAEIGEETTNSNLTLESFNSELNDIIKIKLPTTKELTKQYIKSYIDCSYQVMCLDEDYISLFIDLTSFRTGNLINEKRIFKNIDIKNSKIVEIKDLLGANYKEKCINTIKNKIDKFDEELKKDLKQDYKLEEIVNDKTLFFINNNHLPVLAIERNQIAVGPVGYLSFVIK